MKLASKLAIIPTMKRILTVALLLPLALPLPLGLRPATAAEQIGTFPCRNLSELKAKAGREGMTCILLGFAQPGDGGGGTFYWAAQPPAPANEGTIVAAKDGGAWIRLFDGPIRASWFGAIPFSEETTPASDFATEATRRLQRALEAAAGNALHLSAGIFYVSDTLIIPANTQVEGAGPHDVWTRGKGGTTLRPYGTGKPQIWQDTGNPGKDRLRPLLVFSGSNVRLRNIGIHTVEDKKTDTTCWDVGVLLPATKRCTLDQVAIQGLWQVAACILDATWSERNKRMIELHGGKITPSSMNECTIMRCFLSGTWGLMIRGVDVDKRDPRDYRDYEGKGIPDREPEWLWSYGGASDIEVISCRIEGKAAKHAQALDGGAFYSDAPLVNGAKAGQGHRFFGCNFRTNTRYMLKLGSSNRDSFVSCYFEGGYASPPGNSQSREVFSELKNDPERTGQTRFIDCRFTTVETKSFWDYRNTWSWPDDTAKKSR